RLAIDGQSNEIVVVGREGVQACANGLEVPAPYDAEEIRVDIGMRGLQQEQVVDRWRSSRRGRFAFGRQVVVIMRRKSGPGPLAHTIKHGRKGLVRLACPDLPVKQLRPVFP